MCFIHSAEFTAVVFQYPLDHNLETLYKSKAILKLVFRAVEDAFESIRHFFCVRVDPGNVILS